MDDELDVDIITYNAYLDALVKGGQAQKALAVFRDMRVKDTVQGLPPSPQAQVLVLTRTRGQLGACVPRRDFIHCIGPFSN